MSALGGKRSWGSGVDNLRANRMTLRHSWVLEIQLRRSNHPEFIHHRRDRPPFSSRTLPEARARLSGGEAKVIPTQVLRGMAHPT